MINLTIDEQPVTVPAGTTIMEAAETLGIQIPRLCYHPYLSLQGSCRVCIVDVKDMGFYMASCSVKAWENMDVQTNSPEIRQARRDIVELLLDNHPMDCQTCERDGHCELQNLAYSLGVRERLYEGQRKKFPLENNGRSVIRESEKCVLCGRCYRVCDEIQGVCNLSQQGRGFRTVVTPAHGADMDESVCIQCGQCINVCPVASFLEQNHTDNVWDALADPDKHVVVQTAPSIRAAIGEGFGLEPGTPVTGKMVTALRRLGFDAVFDTDLGADLTIMEESNEFLERMQHKAPLPMITSCSPGWVSFMEKFYPELIPHASTCRSPMTMLSVLAKTYYAQKMNVAPESIYMVAIMPCVAKKFECRRPEHYADENSPYTDAVLTTREAIWMIKCYGIDFVNLEDGEFDAPLGISTGGGDIFGTTGGVMEATLRTAAARLGKAAEDNLEFHQVRAVEGLREADVTLGDQTIHVGVANGLQNAKTLLDQVINQEKQFHIIEVMACPGGCIGGGGQPYPQAGYDVLDKELLQKRAQALYDIDTKKTLRRSHENPALKTLYEEFLGQTGGPKAHELLHTHYHPQEPRGIRATRSALTPQLPAHLLDALPPDIVNAVNEARNKPHPEGELISILHKVQKHFGYLGTEQMDAVAQLLEVPTATVSGVATFYHFFRLQPRGTYVISVCLGTACYVKGAEQVTQKLKEELGIDFGETTTDGLFSLNASRCLGTCGIAPVIMVNDQIHGNLTPDQIPALLEKYIKEAKVS